MMLPLRKPNQPSAVLWHRNGRERRIGENMQRRQPLELQDREANAVNPEADGIIALDFHPPLFAQRQHPPDSLADTFSANDKTSAFDDVKAYEM